MVRMLRDVSREEFGEFIRSTKAEGIPIGGGVMQYKLDGKVVAQVYYPVNGSPVYQLKH